MTSQGRGSQGGRGGGCPPVFREICPFSPKKRGFQENFKILPPSFSKLKVLPPLFFGASYGPASLCFFFSFIFCILFQLHQRPLQSKSYLLTPKNKKSTNFWSNLRNTKKIPNVTFAICTCYKA